MRIHGVVLLVVLLGCGPKPSKEPEEPEAGIPDDLVRLVENEIAFFEQVAGAAKGGADCDAIAVNLEALVDSPDRAVVGTAEKHPDYKAHEPELQTRYADRIDDAFSELLTAVTPCAEHAGVEAAMTNLGF